MHTYLKTTQMDFGIEACVKNYPLFLIVRPVEETNPAQIHILLLTELKDVVHVVAQK